MKWTVFDLDGCVSDDRWRREFLERGEYDEYHDRAHRDEPINQDYVRRASHCCFVTARPEAYRRDTLLWIDEHLQPKAYRLFMRPNDDMRTSPALKPWMLAQHGIDTTDVLVAYDNRQDVIDAYRRLGYNAQLLGTPVTVPQILADMAETFRERDAQYGQTYLRFGEVCAAAFPQGVQLDGADQFARFGVVVQCFGKLLRYVAQPEGHKDSAHDLAVYAAILESLTENK